MNLLFAAALLLAPSCRPSATAPFAPPLPTSNQTAAAAAERIEPVSLPLCELEHIAWAPNAAYFVDYCGPFVELRDGKSGQILSQRRLSGTVTLARVSPDAKTVAVVLSDRVEVRTAPDLAYRAVVRMPDAPGSFLALAFAPDSKQWALYRSAGGGSLVVARDDGQVVFQRRFASASKWAVHGSVAYAKRQIIVELDGVGTLVYDDQGQVRMPQWLNCAHCGHSVNSDGSRIALLWDEAVTIWDVDRDRELTKLKTRHDQRQSQWVGPLFLSQTGRGFALLDLDRPGHQEPLGALTAGDQCAYAAESDIVRCAGGGRLWWRKLGNERDTNVIEPPPTDVLVGPGGLVAETRVDRAVLRRGASKVEVLAESQGHFQSLAFSSAGVLLMSETLTEDPSTQSRLVTLDVTGHVTRSAPMDGTIVHGIFDGAAKRVVLVVENTLTVFDARSLSLIKRIECPLLPDWLAWRPVANQVVVTDLKGNMAMIDLDQGKVRRELSTGVPNARIWPSPDGGIIAVLGVQGNGVLWSEHGSSALSLEHNARTDDLHFSPHGRRLSLVDREALTEVELVDGRAGAMRRRPFDVYVGHGFRPVRRFSPMWRRFSPEGEVYVRGVEGQLLWLDPISWQQRAEPEVSGVRRVELSNWRGARLHVGLPAPSKGGQDRWLALDLSQSRVVRQWFRPAPKVVRYDGKVGANDDTVVDFETGAASSRRVTAWSEQLELKLGSDGVIVNVTATGVTRLLRVPDLRHATFAADDDWLILVSTKGRVSTLNWRNGEVGSELDKDAAAVVSSRNRRTLAILGVQGKELSIYDSLGFALLRREALPVPAVLVALSNDGEQVAVADSNAMVAVWSKNGPKREYPLRSDVAIADLMFDSSGQHLLIGGNLLRFLRLRDGEVLSAWVADLDHATDLEPVVLMTDTHGNVLGDRRILSNVALQLVRQGQRTPFDVRGVHERTDLWSRFQLGQDESQLGRQMER